MNDSGSLFDRPLEPPYYNETHVAWRDSLRRFVEEELEPHVTKWDEQGDVPMEAHRRCAEFGLTGLGYPEQYGGYTEGIDRFHAAISAQELARLGAGGVTTALTTHVIGLPPVLAGGSADLKERVAPDVIAGRRIIGLAITEPEAGSDVANLQTRAARKGDHYVVNGSKTYISGGEKADFLTVAVRTGGGGADGVSLLLLEKGMPGFTTTPLKKQGWWASDTAALYFDAVKVPVENLIGEENRGFHLIMGNFNSERLWMAAGAISFAQVCLEEATRWAQDRRTFGKRLADHQVIRHKLVEMYRMINTSQAFLERCI